jgi:hypothetical protein
MYISSFMNTHSICDEQWIPVELHVSTPTAKMTKISTSDNGQDRKTNATEHEAELQFRSNTTNIFIYEL